MNRVLLLWKKTNSIISAVYVAVIIAIFPLFFRDYYFDILIAKYQFFYAVTIGMIIAVLIAAIYFVWRDWRLNQLQIVKGLRCHLGVRSFRKCDWAMAAFVLANVISTFQSEFFYESFWGNEGRFMGLFLILLYGSSYFIISRFFRFRKWYLDLFMAAGVCACLVGILQYVGIDFLGFKNNISMGDFKAFASTFGNINTYVSYIALVTGVGVTLFVFEIHKVKKWWYLFTVNIAFIALITGISDNGYLALAAVFGLLPLYLFRSLKGIKQYMLVVSVLFTDIQLVDMANQIFPDRVLGISSLFNFITDCGYLASMVVVLWAVTVGMYIVDASLDKSGKARKANNMGVWIWLGIILLSVFIIAGVLYDANLPGNTEKYGPLSQYLVMNEDWGSSRGYVWGISADMFRNFSFLHKLFGYGPDTFGILMLLDYSDKVAANGIIFDSAHNEYLHYLITTGIVGLTAYLTFLAASIIQMLRTCGKRPELAAIVFGVISYGAQAFVTINVPMVSPIMLTLIMMGVAVGNEETEVIVPKEEKSFREETEEMR